MLLIASNSAKYVPIFITINLSPFLLNKGTDSKHVFGSTVAKRMILVKSEF